MMAGVVRRDGLREAVTAVLRDHNLVSYFGDGKCMGCDVALFEGKITSTADLKLASEAAAEHRADMLLALLDAVPDVPPDPPTADRDELARVLHDHPGWTQELDEEKSAEKGVRYWRFRCAGCKELLPRGSAGEGLRGHQADALSGVLVDAADVRARAQQEIYDRAAYWSDKFGKEVPVGCIYLDTTPPTEDDIAWAQEVAERLGLTDRDAR